MNGPSDHVRVSAAGAIATIVIDRPERRNALSLAIKRDLQAAVETLSGDPAVRVILLTGAGNCFVAGTDIAEMAGMTTGDHIALRTDSVFHALRGCDKLLIAAVEGYALGGGCELALCCDLIVAGEGARFGQPEIRVGIMPGAGGTQAFVRAMGRHRAMKLLLTGEPVAARDALALGLLSEVVADGAALAAATELAGQIVAMPPLAVAAIRDLVRKGPDLPFESALAMERQAFVLLFGSEDQKEGMRAFLDKRQPVYHGR
jgi:enoyl-CoA hydratase